MKTIDELTKDYYDLTEQLKDYGLENFDDEKLKNLLHAKCKVCSRIVDTRELCDEIIRERAMNWLYVYYPLHEAIKQQKIAACNLEKHISDAKLNMSLDRFLLNVNNITEDIKKDYGDYMKVFELWGDILK